MITTDAKAVFDVVAPLAGLNPSKRDWVSSMGVVREGSVVGGFLFEDYTGSSVWLHAAGVRVGWASPTFLKIAFWYVFEQLGCEVLRARVLSGRTEAVSQALRMGFRVEAVLKDAAPDEHEYILAMRKSTCRFLRAT